MIEEIRISGLGVIDASTLELGPGLTVLTGETGAGKTMVVTALGLLLGGRADAGAVRRGAKQARVEGLVRTEQLPQLAAGVEDAGGEVDEEGVVLARTIAAQGRSRAFVGGAQVPVARLASLAEPLVAVHGQSDQHRLLRLVAQREALDSFAADAVAGPRERYRAAHTALQETCRELADVESHARERAREADLLRFGLGEIEAVDPQPGEDAQLAEEESRLGFADELRTAAHQAREVLSSDEGAPDALAALGTARSLLDQVRDHDPVIADLADRVAEATALVTDVAADVSSYAASVDADPARLATVSERRAALTGLTRKYGETLAEVLDWARQGAQRLLDLDGTDERIEQLRAEEQRLRVELATAGVELSAARSAHAERLAEAIGTELALLAMPHAQISVRVTQQPLGDDQEPARDASWVDVEGRRLRADRSGLDEVQFLLAANKGAEPRPLDKGASGGELSRVMLALEVSLAGTSTVPTFVFDEVDSGVGGRAAVEIGRRLAALARTSQVLVVTHLPQVAAYADRHVVVHKSHEGTVTTSGLSALDDAERVRELSRMLAGMDESDSAMAHAKELLDTAAADRADRASVR